MDNPFDKVFGDEESLDAVGAMYACASILRKAKTEYFCGKEFSEKKARLLEGLNAAMVAIEGALYAVVIGDKINKIIEVSKRMEEDDYDSELN